MREKSETLAYWGRVCRGTLSADSGGSGLPDGDMIPWCKRLNAIPGVCTVQSCSGHPPDADGYRSSAHVWIKLSGPLSRLFRECAPTLAKEEHVDRLSTAYMPDGSEIVVVEFAGNERGLLDYSMDSIASFFESLFERLVWGEG